MNDPKDDRQSEAQPWHAADEKPAKKGDGAPIGTPSFTGASANIGLPVPPKAEKDQPERSTPREMPPGAEEPDPLAEPRAGGGDLLGRKG
jgi:hypothetical protein